MADNITRTSDRYTTSDSDYKVKYDGLDPVGGYLGDKIVAGANITIEENENKLVISASGGSATDELVKYNADDSTAGYLADKVIAGDGITIAEGTGADENKLVVTNSTVGDYVTEVTVVNDETFPISYLQYVKNGLTYDITEIPKSNGLIQGGAVSWVELLKFDVSAAAYYLEGLLYTTASTRVTLDAADALLPRIDIIIIDNTETVSFVTGVPNANPQKPTVDPVTQIELTNILVPAGATEPGITITQEIIYNENTEWVGSSSGVTVDFADVAQPYDKTVDTLVGTLTNNDTVTYTKTATSVAHESFEKFIFNIRLVATVANQHNLYVRWLENGVSVSNEVKVPLTKSNITNYQNINMSLSLWTWNQNNVDAVQFRWSRSGGATSYAGFYLDLLKLEKGITVIPSSSGIELIGDITGIGITGTPVNTTLATVNSNIGTFGDTSNVAQVTVDGKGRITAISNVAVSTGDEKVKYDAGDPTAGYIADKIVSGTGISVTEGSGANENKLVITNSALSSYVESVEAIPDEQWPILYLKYSKGGVDYDITEIPKPDGLLAGGRVSWVEGLKFDITAAIYYILGLFYTSPSSRATLSASDPVLNRIDAIIVDVNEVVSVIEGIPAANPQKPSIDPATQIELTYVLIPAGATVPDLDIGEEIVYDENIEWTGSASGVLVNFAYLFLPYHGLTCIDVGTIGNNDTISFTSASLVDRTDFEDFIFNISLKGIMPNQHRLFIRFYNGTTPVSNEVQPAINKKFVIGYQNMSMKLSSFTWMSSSFDTIVFRYSRSSGNTTYVGFSLDYIKLQTSVTTVLPVNTGIELTGDVTGTGTTGSPILTSLAILNPSPAGTYGGASAIPVVTVDTKGRVTAVTTESISTADEKVKYNTDDTVSGYLADKIVAGTGISLTEGVDGDADKLVITNSVVNTDEKVKYNTDDLSSGYLADKVVAGTGITIEEGTGTDVDKLKISSSFVEWVTAPTTKTSEGVVGQKAYNSNYLYVCTATNVWKRIPLATNW